MHRTPRTLWLATILAAGAALLTSCGLTPRQAAPPAPTPGPATTPVPVPPPMPRPATTPSPPVPPVAAPATAPSPPAPPVAAPAAPAVSQATDARAYRRDAARHLYALNADRIYQGVMQPNLYAIGVLEVEIDRQGRVSSVHWRRAPSHAPEVMAEIVRTVRAAAPFPLPARLGRVTYTDIWLWDKSSRFQLDTLTEGQL